MNINNNEYDPEDKKKKNHKPEKKAASISNGL